MVLTLTTHTEKIQFLTNFLHGYLEDYPRTVPLMLIGTGGNGKSSVIYEVSNTSPVNILILFHDGQFHFVPSKEYSDDCVILLHANGAPSEYALATCLNANSVRFEKDPAFNV